MPSATVKTFEILTRPEPKPFPLDGRIGVINNVNDFALYRGFVGALLCSYNPFTAEDDELILAFARAVIAGQTSIKSTRTHDNPFPFWQINRGDPCPQPLRMAFDTVVKAFTDVYPKHKSLSSIRINATWPHIPEAHEPSMTYAVFEEGTEFINENGIWINAPRRHIFVFDNEITHRASQKRSPDKIRITCLAS